MFSVQMRPNHKPKLDSNFYSQLFTNLEPPSDAVDNYNNFPQPKMFENDYEVDYDNGGTRDRRETCIISLCSSEVIFVDRRNDPVWEYVPQFYTNRVCECSSSLKNLPFKNILCAGNNNFTDYSKSETRSYREEKCHAKNLGCITETYTEIHYRRRHVPHRNFSPEHEWNHVHVMRSDCQCKLVRSEYGRPCMG